MSSMRTRAMTRAAVPPAAETNNTRPVVDDAKKYVELEPGCAEKIDETSLSYQTSLSNSYSMPFRGQSSLAPQSAFKADDLSTHCFERSALRSSTYIIRDAAAIGILVYAALHIESALNQL